MGRHKKILSESEICLYPADRDISKRWYIEYFSEGKTKRVWLSAQFKDVKSRTIEFERIKSELLVNGAFEKPKQPEAYVPELIASKRLKTVLDNRVHLKSKSFSSYKSKIKLFDEFCEAQGYTAINDKVAEAYLNHRIKEGKSVNTVNNDRRVLSTFVKSLSISSKSVKKNAFDNTKKLKGGGGAGREYYKPHQKAMLKAFFEKEYPALWFACKFVYYCFVRNGNELVNLRISDLDLHLRRLRVTAGDSKNGFDEQIVIPKNFAAELAAIDYSKYPQNWFLVGKNGLPTPNRVSNGYWGKQHRKALDALGFDKGGKRYSMYSWKNTGVVDAYRAKVGIKDLQGQLRHKNLNTTYLYLKCLGLFDNDDTFDNISL